MSSDRFECGLASDAAASQERSTYPSEFADSTARGAFLDTGRRTGEVIARIQRGFVDVIARVLGDLLRCDRLYREVKALSWEAIAYPSRIGAVLPQSELLKDFCRAALVTSPSRIILLGEH